MKKTNRKGFTLIELLVVIAIIAILAVVVILTLNPAELLRQSRDSNRVSDFATLKSAIALYLADVSSTSIGASTTIYVASASGAVTSSTFNGTSTANNWGTTGIAAVATSTSRVITGTGWLPINFSAISSGAPVGIEPVDPLGTAVNTGCTSSGVGCMYVYEATSTNNGFKLSAKMESTKYSTGGAGDVETNDGGVSTSTFEAGTTLSL